MAYYDPNRFDNGASFGMEPDALATAYARATPTGQFQGIAQPASRRRPTRARAADPHTNAGAFFGLAGNALPQQRQALSGGFAALRILNEQQANPTAL